MLKIESDFPCDSVVSLLSTGFSPALHALVLNQILLNVHLLCQRNVKKTKNNYSNVLFQEVRSYYFDVRTQHRYIIWLCFSTVWPGCTVCVTTGFLVVTSKSLWSVCKPNYCQILVCSIKTNYMTPPRSNSWTPVDVFYKFSLISSTRATCCKLSFYSYC